MRTSAASEPLNFFIIVLYDLWPTYCFSVPFLMFSFANGRIDQFTDLINDLLIRYYTY